MTDETDNNVVVKIVIILIKLFINYVKYCFLTITVMFSFGILLFIILGLNIDLSFSFLQYFSFLNPEYKTRTFNIGVEGIMGIFSIISFIVGGIIAIIRYLLKKLFGLEITISLKQKIYTLFTIVTLAYILAAIIIALTDSIEKSFYFILIVFYIINFICLAGYSLIDVLLTKIHQASIKQPQIEM